MTFWNRKDERGRRRRTSVLDIDRLMSIVHLVTLLGRRTVMDLQDYCRATSPLSLCGMQKCVSGAMLKCIS